MLKYKKPAYSTCLGAAYCIDSLQALSELNDNSINLVITSPPFALQRQKEYGNKNQDTYIEWLADFAKLVRQKLCDDGSFVIDLGGAYQAGIPSRSLYNFKVLIYLCDVLKFHLAQDFYWHNPSKLPGPIEWVNKRKIRAKDSVNTIWWLSKTPFPKANICNVLTEYSARTKKLIQNPEAYYSPKKRPSGHDIGANFGKDNGGAIPSNLLQISNSESNSRYLSLCKSVNSKPHPARYPEKLPSFFIELLTEPNDLVVDIFSGSNTTGIAAEKLARRWLSFEENIEYVANSVFRFTSLFTGEEIHTAYHDVIAGEHIVINRLST